MIDYRVKHTKLGSIWETIDDDDGTIDLAMFSQIHAGEYSFIGLTGNRWSDTVMSETDTIPSKWRLKYDSLQEWKEYRDDTLNT